MKYKNNSLTALLEWFTKIKQYSSMNYEQQPG